jgi:hypothetical protein
VSHARLDLLGFALISGRLFYRGESQRQPLATGIKHKLRLATIQSGSSLSAMVAQQRVFSPRP